MAKIDHGKSHFKSRKDFQNWENLFQNQETFSKSRKIFQNQEKFFRVEKISSKSKKNHRNRGIISQIKKNVFKSNFMHANKSTHRSFIKGNESPSISSSFWLKNYKNQQYIAANPSCRSLQHNLQSQISRAFLLGSKELQNIYQHFTL